MSRPDFLTEYAIKRAGMPTGWRWFKWEATGPYNGPKQAQGHSFTGAVVPDKTRGKRAGQPNWRSRDRAKDVTIVVSAIEFERFIREWEIETGLCSDCGGSGEVVASWTAAEGITNRPCRKCSATGKAEQAA